jgi:hypothetical protein
MSLPHAHRRSEEERIELLRGGSVISSFAGSFGGSLRETRLTAMLGYVIALAPQRFCEQFGFRGTPLTVTLEMREELDRSDILIETTLGRGVIVPPAVKSASEKFAIFVGRT